MLSIGQPANAIAVDDGCCLRARYVGWRFRKRAWTKANRDRKSTRLNSSHPSISYAVFCLKKKKKNNFNPSYIRLLKTRNNSDGIVPLDSFATVQNVRGAYMLYISTISNTCYSDCQPPRIG